VVGAARWLGPRFLSWRCSGRWEKRQQSCRTPERDLVGLSGSAGISMKVKKNIVLLPGDGIGPEVTKAAATVLRECAQEFHHEFDLHEFPIGGAAIDAAGTPLPNETLDACKKADAVFLGAVGGAKWDALPVGKRPESGLLGLRKGMGLYVNVRPVKVLEPLRGISPLKPERLGDLDIEIVRELAGGMYFGERGNVTENGVERAWDTESYSTPEIERIATFAYGRAENRSRRLCSVDKANVLMSSQLWRRTVVAMSGVYSAVKLEHMYVDNAAMQLTLKPSQFDVMLTSNMFGDILSDAAAALVGSIGLIPSASFGTGAPLFEPIHGSAPSLVGTDSANPVGSILSATLMLRDAFGLSLEADWVEQSLHRVLAGGYRTPDIAQPGASTIGGSVFTEMLREEMQRTLEHAERYGWGV
jgi:3-isopropylmalate dehydrogenase